MQRALRAREHYTACETREYAPTARPNARPQKAGKKLQIQTDKRIMRIALSLLLLFRAWNRILLNGPIQRTMKFRLACESRICLSIG